MKNAYTISRLINDMLKNVVLRDTSPCCSHLTMRMGAAYPSNTSASPYRTTRVVPKVMSNFFFACELGIADEGEYGGRWNQLLCYP